MPRYHITLGASTSAGGKVISASSCCSIDGVAVALEGDAIFCPACRSPGKIKIFGPRIPESWNGTQVALEDDLCVCQCSPPPRLIASQQRKWQALGGSEGGGDDDSGGAGAAHSAAAATQAASAAREATQASALGAQDEQVRLRFVDELTHAAMATRRYRLELPGKVMEGRTDKHGYTQPIDAADRAALIAWHILD
jgi:uncharacterized Zn-binding protein involved in type VI secretion